MLRIVKIKICGITNVDDALAAVNFGADIIGFNFYPKSPRYINPEDAWRITDKLPTFVDTAAIFVNASLDEIKQVTQQGFLTWIQLHGDETPEFCDSLRYLGPRTIKAIRVRQPDDILLADQYYTDAILFDGYDPNHYGGTGKSFDWASIPNLNRRIFLAGGVSPENIAQAIDLGVYGLDICSSIEERPGKKDHKKMKLMFDNLNMVRG